MPVILFFFFQAEDGIRDLVRSRGLGDVYKRQARAAASVAASALASPTVTPSFNRASAYTERLSRSVSYTHLTLPTSDLV